MSYADEISADYGVISYWPFSDPAGTDRAYDQIGGNHLSVTGNVSFGVPGIIDIDAARLSSANQVQVLSDSFDFPGRSPMSVELWIAPDVSDNFPRRLLSKYEGNDGWELVNQVPQGLSFFRYHGAAAPLYPDISLLPSSSLFPSAGVAKIVDDTDPVAPLKAGVQAFVVATYDGLRTRIYVDGELKASMLSSTSIGANKAALRVGDTSNGGVPQTGVYQSVAIYSVVLSQRQISSHYANGRKILSDPQRVKTYRRITIPSFP